MYNHLYILNDEIYFQSQSCEQLLLNTQDIGKLSLTESEKCLLCILYEMTDDWLLIFKKHLSFFHNIPLNSRCVTAQYFNINPLLASLMNMPKDIKITVSNNDYRVEFFKTFNIYDAHGEPIKEYAEHPNILLDMLLAMALNYYLGKYAVTLPDTISLSFLTSFDKWFDDKDYAIIVDTMPHVIFHGNCPVEIVNDYPLIS